MGALLLTAWLASATPAQAEAASQTRAEVVALEWEMTRHTRVRYLADRPEIEKRKVLRVLTRNNSSAYYLARGEQRGFEFELAQAFASSLGVRLAMVVPPSRDDLLEQLRAGEGDLIAAGTTVTSSRAAAVLFTSPVRRAPRVLVTHAWTVKTLERPEDAAQFSLHLNLGSTTRDDARALEARIGRPLTIVDLTEGMEMERMIEAVARGDFEATIVDRDLLELEQASGLPVEARLEVSAPLDKAWAVRKSSPLLHAAAQAFVEDARRSGLLKILYDRYYRAESRTARRAQDPEFRADQAGKISPYDELFRRAGKETAIDWRLLAAVAYTESRFDPAARSAWGAVGLMQVLPSTAAEVGVKDPLDPAGNILAGSRYLRRLMNTFKEKLDQRQKARFALAAYNAGLAHVQDARRLAPRIGKDPNAWFGHVEEALKLKRLPEWHEKTQAGYCRADETVGYVSKVQSWYDVYVRHVPLFEDR